MIQCEVQLGQKHLPESAKSLTRLASKHKPANSWDCACTPTNSSPVSRQEEEPAVCSWTPSPRATRTVAQRVSLILKTTLSPKPLSAMVALLCLLFKSSHTSNISCSCYVSSQAARYCLLQRFGPLRTGTLGSVVLSEKNRTEALGGQGKLQN